MAWGVQTGHAAATARATLISRAIDYPHSYTPPVLATPHELASLFTDLHHPDPEPASHHSKLTAGRLGADSHAVQCSAVQCSATMQCSAVQCSAAMQCSAAQCSAVRCSHAAQCSAAMQCSAVQCSAVQCSHAAAVYCNHAVHCSNAAAVQLRTSRPKTSSPQPMRHRQPPV